MSTDRHFRRGSALMLVLSLLLPLPFPERASAAPTVPTDSGWPLEGEVRVLRPFTPPTTGWGAGHRGVDLAAHRGDLVLAAASGRVTIAARITGRGVVVVDHGSVRTTYEPVTATVRVGTRVGRGDPIGVLANSAHGEAGPCLHWGLLRGHTYLDPVALATRGVHVRLLAADAPQLVERRAAARAAALSPGNVGPAATTPDQPTDLVVRKR